MVGFAQWRRQVAMSNGPGTSGERGASIASMSRSQSANTRVDTSALMFICLLPRFATAHCPLGSSTDDATYTRIQARLSTLANLRDALAQQIKLTLGQAENGHRPGVFVVVLETVLANVLIQQAHQLATGVS
jgi:hypothetical protein